MDWYKPAHLQYECYFENKSKVISKDENKLYSSQKETLYRHELLH